MEGCQENFRMSSRKFRAAAIILPWGRLPSERDDFWHPEVSHDQTLFERSFARELSCRHESAEAFFSHLYTLQVYRV